MKKLFLLSFVSLIFGFIGVLSWALLPATASAADSIYWGNENGAVRVGNLDGSGVPPTSPADVFAGATPCGVAIDPAAGKIYWASWGSNAIQVGNLDGTGTASTLFDRTDGVGDGPCGVAIDPAAGKIYWASWGSNAIQVGNLDGTGSVTTLFDGTDGVGKGPSGVAIDPVAGKIYWSTQDSNQIQVGNLDGTDTASTVFSGEDNPIGVAIDPVAGKIYWTNCGGGDLCSGTNPGTIRVGTLDGKGVETLFDRAVSADNVNSGPAGLAIDPGAGKIYWGTFGSSTVQVGNLDGSGSATTLFSSATGEYLSNFPVLLKTPAGTGLPGISESGGKLACSQGIWAPDLLGAFLYRAPQSFAYQWLLDGTEIDGATASTYTATADGAYTCTVTASNHAGSASQTSAPFVIFNELGELGDAHLWIGLKNSDDQGTQFDLRVELLKNGAPVASGLKRCITGVTRNPSFATEAVVPWDTYAPVPLSSSDVLALRVSTRIGTNTDGTKCSGPGGSHNNAVGLRLYYDATGRASRFEETNSGVYLHANGGACGVSPAATVWSADSTAPTGPNAKCKDSASVNFAGGNPWKVIGTWSLAPLP